MTVPTLASAITVGATGASSYAFPFIGVSASDIGVIYTNTFGAQAPLPPTAYSVTINAPLIGQIWGQSGLIIPSSPSSFSSGTLTIGRILPLTQSAEISNQGNQYPLVTEQALDILCMEIQQVAARGGAFRGTWATNVSYGFGDIVVDGVNGSNTTNWYLCAIANTSGTWTTDLANGDWALILNLQSIANPGTVAAGGDLTGNYPNPTIAKIQGTPVTGVTGSGKAVLGTAPTLSAPLLAGATSGNATLQAAAVTTPGTIFQLPASNGTNGQVLGTTGLGVTNWVSSSGRLLNIQVFTSSATYTPTTGTGTAIAELLGGGAGGGGAAQTGSATSMGGGGGAGSYARVSLTAAQIGTSQAVTIGGSGNGGSAGNNNGNNGGATSLGGLVSCPGGNAGVGSSGASGASPGSSGGAATAAPTVSTGTALISIAGAPGSFGIITSGVTGVSGAGANSVFGSGGQSAVAIGGTNMAGKNATGFGAGGGGGACVTTPSPGQAGGNGTPGIVIIYDYA